MLLPFLKSKYLEDGEVFRVFEINDTGIEGRIKNKGSEKTQVNNTNNEEYSKKENSDLTILRAILKLKIDAFPKEKEEIRRSLFNLAKTYSLQDLYFWIDFLGGEKNCRYVKHIEILMESENEFGRDTVVEVTNILRNDKKDLFYMPDLVSNLNLLKKTKVENTDDEFFNY